MATTSTTTHRSWAASGSLLFHAAFVVLLLLAMRGCGGGGDGTQYMALSIASLGEFEQGLGDPNDPAAASAPQPTETDPVEEAVETVDDSPVSAPRADDKPRPNPTTDRPKEQPKEQPKQPSDGLNNALNQLGKPGGGSSGSTQPGGNEGAPDGQISGKGVFSGSGGSGEWALSGRNMRSKPALDERPTEEGTVVVDIWVDKSGNVVKAVANASHPKTTTNSAQLYALAEKAAKAAKFTASEAAAQQKGTITINFKLR